MRPSKTRSVKVSFSKPSRTIKSAGYDANINNMISGHSPFTQAKRSFYIDETVLPSNYEDCFNLVADAQDAFLQLHPEIREEFHNSPAELAKALRDPKQQDYLRELGVLPPVKVTDGPKPSKKAPPASEAPTSTEAPEGGKE